MNKEDKAYTYEELTKEFWKDEDIIIKQQKEIERLNKIIKQLDIKNLELTSIIKEVREYCINRNQYFNEARIEQYTFSREEEYSIENIIEILDKSGING